MADDLNLDGVFPNSGPGDTGQQGTPGIPSPGEPQEGQAPTPAGDPTNQDNNTIRSMREALANKDKEAATFKAQIDALSKHLGVTPEEFLSQKESEARAAEAKKLGISPELQARIDAQEKALKEMQEEKIRGRFETNMNNLMQEHNLTDAQASDFLREANQKGFDVINSPISHADIYFAINRQTIMATEREKIKQEVLADIQAGGSSAPVPAVGGQNPTGGKGTLDDFLSDLQKNKK